MGNKHNLLAAVSLVALSATAHADDMTAPEVSDWTGFYLGAGGGGNYLFSSLSVDDFPMSSRTRSDDTDVARGFGTIELGADYQFDSNFLIGAVGNFDFSAGTDLGSFATTGTPLAEWEGGNSWGIGARTGFLASPRTLIYGVGGFTQLVVRTDLGNNNGTAAVTSDDELASGYFVGAGVETLLTDKLSLKLEYRFSRYDEVSATSGSNIGPMPDPTPMPMPDPTPGSGSGPAPCDPGFECHTFADIDNHTVRVTLTWRFGR